MAYYIFLKSLRSPEEFRKNPHIKIPPKSPSTNFQSLDKFKNPIFNSEIIFSLLSAQPTLRPVRPLAQPAQRPRHPRRLKQSWPAHPARASIASSREIRFPFRITPSRAGRLSLVSLSTGPTCQIHPLPHAGRPRLEIPHAAAPPRLGCPPAFTALPHHSPP
jgi:hypothetical protein